MREAIHSLYLALNECDTLRPGPLVNDLFGRLVELVLNCPPASAAAVLDDPRIHSLRPKLRSLCSEGEQELEVAWASRIATSSEPRSELAGFPYLAHYRQLCRMEIDLLNRTTGAAVRSVAFIGAGPLPLSAIMLAGELGVQVDGLDRDPQAVASARAVVHALGVPGVRFRVGDVSKADLASYDLVVLAALVGTSGLEKRRILRRLASSMTPRTLLLARSVRGLRTLLYPDIELMPHDGFEVLAIEHPEGDVINSAILARVAEGAGVGVTRRSPPEAVGGDLRSCLPD
jgi:nicotianamine synthase